jgi:hypothetical protein
LLPVAVLVAAVLVAQKKAAAAQAGFVQQRR